MFKSVFYTLLFCVLIGFGASCTRNNRFKIENSQTDKPVHIIRFDSLIMNADTVHIMESVRKFYANYPDFFSIYIEQIMGSKASDTTEVAQQLKSFIANKDFKKVNNDVASVFKNTDSIENNIQLAYQYLNHYFPEINTPPVYFFVSGFNRSIIINDKFVGIGLDLYLGNTYPRYSEISYQYMTYNMRPASIAPDIISALLFKHFRFDGNQERLMENMLFRGKVLYLLSVIMPELKPNEIMGFNRFQWEWSRKYEDKIWHTIVGQKDLYSTDQLLINKYLNDAPFTATVSQESPGRLGTWVGWQIIQHYMENNSDISLQTLMKTTDYQTILNKSGYNP